MITITHKASITWQVGDTINLTPEIEIVLTEIVRVEVDRFGVNTTQAKYNIQFDHLMVNIGDCE